MLHDSVPRENCGNWGSEGENNGLRTLSKGKGFFSDFPNAVLLSYYYRSLVPSALRKPGPLCLLEKWGNLAVMVELNLRRNR